MKLVGYRAFQLTLDWLPAGMNRGPQYPLIKTRGQLWPPDKPVVAECRPYGSRRHDHMNLAVHGKSPSKRCKCGIHAFADYPDLRAAQNKRTGFTPYYGLVVGWGQWYGGYSPDGYHYWRAEKVQLVALPPNQHPSFGQKWELLAEYYQVPIMPVKALRAYAEEIGEKMPTGEVSSHEGVSD